MPASWEAPWPGSHWRQRPNTALAVRSRLRGNRGFRSSAIAAADQASNVDELNHDDDDDDGDNDDDDEEVATNVETGAGELSNNLRSTHRLCVFSAFSYRAVVYL